MSAVALTTDATYEYRSCGGTPLLDPEFLERMGRQGWELLDFTAERLYFRRPVDPTAVRWWEYLELSAAQYAIEYPDLLQNGWSPAGSWVLFRCFKRARP